MSAPNLKTIQTTALRLLARREHSRAELKRKLSLKGFPADLIELVLDQLKVNNLQNDLRFAESYVRTCVEKGDGILKIQMKMQEKGLAADIIKQTLLPADNIFWQQQLTRKWQKKLLVTGSDLKAHAKIIRFLQSRGFTLAQINSFIRNSKI